MAIEIKKKERIKTQYGNCRTILTYEYSDLENIRVGADYRGEDTIHVMGFACPVCGHVVEHQTA